MNEARLKATDLLEFLNSSYGVEFILEVAKKDLTDRLTEKTIVELRGGVVEALLLCGDDLLPGIGTWKIRLVIERGEEDGLKVSFCEIARIGSPEAIYSLAYGSSIYSLTQIKVRFARVNVIEKAAAKTGLATDRYRCLHIGTKGEEFGFVFVRDLNAEELAQMAPKEVTAFYDALEKRTG